jgi:hypothetical protein
MKVFEITYMDEAQRTRTVYFSHKAGLEDDERSRAIVAHFINAKTRTASKKVLRVMAIKTHEAQPAPGFTIERGNQ